jgi:ABC-2 type transport system ATP-binding protein
MQEVEAMCSRVIIINEGEIVADDKTAHLHQMREGQEFVVVEFAEAVNPVQFRNLDGVKNSVAISATECKIEAIGKVDIRPKIFQYAKEHNLTILSMNKVEQGLEDVFRKLTKK